MDPRSQDASYKDPEIGPPIYPSSQLGGCPDVAVVRTCVDHFRWTAAVFHESPSCRRTQRRRSCRSWSSTLASTRNGGKEESVVAELTNNKPVSYSVTGT